MTPSTRRSLIEKLQRGLAVLLQLRLLAALLAVHRLGDRALLARGLEPGLPFGGTEPRKCGLGALRVVLDAAALQLRDRARKLRVLSLERRLRRLLQVALEDRHLHHRLAERPD